MFLATARENIIASYLKLRLATHSVTPISKIEEKPANVIEASYINLAYSLLRSNHSDQALEALDEGIELFPNSYRLKHAKARIYLNLNKAKLADEIYKELNLLSTTDAIISDEVASYNRRFLLRKHSGKLRNS